MKLLFDQNLSRKLVARLQDLYPNSSHVQFHKLAEVTDTEVWNFAKENGFYIVTQDADFSERSRLYGSPRSQTGLNLPALSCVAAAA